MLIFGGLSAVVCFYHLASLVNAGKLRRELSSPSSRCLHACPKLGFRFSALLAEIVPPYFENPPDCYRSLSGPSGPKCPQRWGVSEGVSDGLSPGPFGGVLRVLLLKKVSRTLPERGARRAPETPHQTLPRARKARETPVPGRGVRNPYLGGPLGSTFSIRFWLILEPKCRIGTKWAAPWFKNGPAILYNIEAHSYPFSGRTTKRQGSMPYKGKETKHGVEHGFCSP